MAWDHLLNTHQLRLSRHRPTDRKDTCGHLDKSDRLLADAEKYFSIHGVI